MYQSPRFRAPFNLQSCLPYKLVNMRSESANGPNLVFVCGGGVPGGGAGAAPELLRATMLFNS